MSGQSGLYTVFSTGKGERQERKIEKKRGTVCPFAGWNMKFEEIIKDYER
jgi:hypothetical protein